jgi:hypothetical protein
VNFPFNLQAFFYRAFFLNIFLLLSDLT